MTSGPVGREMVRRVEDADNAMKHYLASYDIVEEETGEPWRPAVLPPDPDPDPEEAQ